MNSSAKTIFAALFLFFGTTLNSFSQKALPDDPNIRQGSFPNGIRYYIVNNPAFPGRAEYALVQKEAGDPDEVRGHLSSLESFGSRKPYRYFSTNGMEYGREGFLEIVEDHTVYRFREVPTGNEAVSDTALMTIFNIAMLCPTEQAVVISGDVDANSLVGKMSIFSIMISKREPLPEDSEYMWESAPTPTITTGTLHSSRLSEIKVSFASPRPSRESLVTVQGLMSDLMYSELGVLVEERVRESLRVEGMPLAGISVSRKTAAQGPGDESWGIRLMVAADDVPKVVRTLSSVLANIARAGISTEELKDARSRVISDMYASAGAASVPNDEYVDRCVASFLYGAPLWSPVAARDFHLRRVLPPEKEAGFLSSFAAALFTEGENLTLEVNTPGEPMDDNAVYTAYLMPWREEQQRAAYKSALADTLNLLPPAKKARVRVNPVSEAVSGGTTWTLPNGLKVLWRKTATPGMIQYSYIFRGGSSTVENLSRGEAAYFPGLLFTNRLSGIGSSDFARMLRASGVDLRCEVGASDMRLYGSAPASRLNTVLGAIVALANFREADPEALEYYKACTELAVEKAFCDETARLSGLDSLLRPGYLQTPYRYPGCLLEDTPEKAEAYFEREFSRFRESILVLTGDIDELDAEESLCRYADYFRKEKGIHPKRNPRYDLRSGWAVANYPAYGRDEESLSVSVVSTLPGNIERYYAARLIGMMANTRLVAALPATGWYPEVKVDNEYLPVEITRLNIVLRPSDPAGLPAGVELVPGEQVVTIAREVVDALFASEPTAAELKKLKAALVKNIEMWRTTPVGVETSTRYRFSYGKDMFSKNKETIEAITPADIKEMLKSFGEGCKAEYRVMQ